MKKADQSLSSSLGYARPLDGRPPGEDEGLRNAIEGFLPSASIYLKLWIDLA